MATKNGTKTRKTSTNPHKEAIRILKTVKWPTLYEMAAQLPEVDWRES